MAEEALACFTTLLTSVPEWIADLENLLHTSAERQQEIIYAYQPAGLTNTSSAKKSKSKSKTSSLQSTWSSQDNRTARNALNAARHLLKRPSMKHLTNSDALRLSQKKRKTASICSDTPSNTTKPQSKISAVVYYDGETQHRFEKLVRAVGSSRNAIRKGKMSAKVESLARVGSSGSESSSGEEFCPASLRIDAKGGRGTRTPFGRSDTSEAFERVDSCLDKAQALCERAAHKVLRDGDFSLEVTNAREHFCEALRLAEAEIPAFRKRAERQAERRRRSDERQRAEEEAEELRRSVARLSDRIATVVAAAYPSEGILEVDAALEADDASDDDDDDGEFNISSMQLSKFSHMRHMRTSRLAAH